MEAQELIDMMDERAKRLPLTLPYVRTALINAWLDGQSAGLTEGWKAANAAVDRAFAPEPIATEPEK